MIPRPGAEAPPLFAATLPTARPRLTYGVLALLGIIYLLTELTGGSTRSANLIRWGANYAPLITEGEYWRLISANFLHIGIAHFITNAYSLYVLGTQVESLFGPRRFAVLYLFSGMTGALLSYVLTHSLSAGASTSLFGLFGALIVFFYRQREVLGGASRRQLQHLGILLLFNLALGFMPGSNIDNAGHLGGFIGGAALAWFLSPTYARTDPFARAFGEVLPGNRRPELANEHITDTNSLAKQAFVVAAFMVALVALVFAAVYAFQGAA
jgi:membrane associated rhomboid family serine protease